MRRVRGKTSGTTLVNEDTPTTPLRGGPSERPGRSGSSGVRVTEPSSGHLSPGGDLRPLTAPWVGGVVPSQVLGRPWFTFNTKLVTVGLNLGLVSSPFSDKKSGEITRT